MSRTTDYCCLMQAGGRMTLGAGLFQENESHFYQDQLSRKKRAPPKNQPNHRILSHSCWFHGSNRYHTEERGARAGNKEILRQGRECSWAGHSRSRRAVRAAAAICNSGRATSASSPALLLPLPRSYQRPAAKVLGTEVKPPKLNPYHGRRQERLSKCKKYKQTKNMKKYPLQKSLLITTSNWQGALY